MTWERILLVILTIAVIVLGVVSCNLNNHIVAINENGRELTGWAEVGAKWAQHVNKDHVTHEGEAPSHIPPPDDPPPRWQ